MAKYNHALDIFVMHRKQNLLNMSVGSLKLNSEVLAFDLIGNYESLAPQCFFQ